MESAHPRTRETGLGNQTIALVLVSRCPPFRSRSFRPSAILVLPGSCFLDAALGFEVLDPNIWDHLPVYRSLVPKSVIKILGGSFRGIVNYFLEHGIIHVILSHVQVL